MRKQPVSWIGCEECGGQVTSWSFGICGVNMPDMTLHWHNIILSWSVMGTVSSVNMQHGQCEVLNPNLSWEVTQVIVNSLLGCLNMGRKLQVASIQISKHFSKQSLEMSPTKHVYRFSSIWVMKAIRVWVCSNWNSFIFFLQDPEKSSGCFGLKHVRAH